MSQNISLSSIVKDYANIDDRLKAMQAQHRTPDFDHVTIKVKCYEAKKTTTPVNTAPEVVVAGGGAGPELRTDKTLESNAQVQIVTGLCQDLQHRDIQFDLPEGLGQVNMKFKGGKKDIKISQVNVELASSCGNGAKAKAQTNSEEIAMTFLSKVYLKGKVLFHDGQMQIKTQKIIETLKEKRCHSVQHLNNDDRGYYWLMEGTCSMNRSVMHAH